MTDKLVISPSELEEMVERDVAAHRQVTVNGEVVEFRVEPY